MKITQSHTESELANSLTANTRLKDISIPVPIHMRSFFIFFNDHELSNSNFEKLAKLLNSACYQIAKTCSTSPRLVRLAIFFNPSLRV